MKPTAVSNTGPLIALAHADVLPILDGLFERVLLPEAVRNEIDAGKNASVRFAGMSKQCRVLHVELDPAPDALLTGVLDRGEAAVLLLARATKADLTLLDERKGRKIAAEVFRLRVMGTAGLLVRAKRAGLIARVREPLDRMLNAGYYLHERIREHILHLADEGP